VFFNLKKILMWVISTFSAIFILIFCMANRSLVEIDIWPLPHRQKIQLFALLLVCIGIGILWGGVATWLSAGTSRKKIREAKRMVAMAELSARHAEERCCRLEQGLRDLKAQSNPPIIS
jgi:lysylphosphatidylglycerol synthetase-like protein (DUF2156 family)